MSDAASGENAVAEAVDEPVQEKPEEPPVPKSKCIVLMGFGGLKMVKVQDSPQGSPEEDEVAIRVKACGMNFMDLMVRQGVIDNPPKTPVAMGFECAGEIESVGTGVTEFQVGDRVTAFVNFSAWSELVVASKNHVYKIPSQMTFQDAAAIPMNYLSAYLMLFDIGNLRPGQSVLVHSLGGGVGHAVGQLCQTLDNVTVFGTASKSKHESIQSVASHVLDRATDYSQEVRKVSPEGVDIVLDCLCGEDANKGISLLKPMGKYILYGSSNVVTGETKSFFSFAKSWWQVDKISPIKLYDENKMIAGFQLRQLAFKQNRHQYLADIMNKLFQLYNEGRIKPVIDSVFAFEDIGSAMQRMHDRKNIGKLILDPTIESKPQADGSCVTSEEKEPEGDAKSSSE